MILFILTPVVLFGWFTGLNRESLISLAWLTATIYYVMRIILNVCMDYDAEMSSKAIDRKHMSSGYFVVTYDSKTGKHDVKTNGDNRDHSQRCVDSLKEHYAAERWLQFANFYYVGMIIVAFLITNHFLG